MVVDPSDRCPCGTGQAFVTCCFPILDQGAGLGTSAEQLMRARYVAYVHHDADFLLASWHPDTRPATISFDPDLRWTGLEIVGTEAGSGLDTHGVVEFRARFVRSGEFLELHEISRFQREGGHWVYVDGT